MPKAKRSCSRDYPVREVCRDLRDDIEVGSAPAAVDVHDQVAARWQRVQLAPFERESRREAGKSLRAGPIGLGRMVGGRISSQARVLAAV